MLSAHQYIKPLRGLLWISILLISLLACVGSNMVENKNLKQPAMASSSESPPKTPQGYIRSDIYDPGKYGGFRGDCASDANWPFYWECMSENAGSDFQ